MLRKLFGFPRTRKPRAAEAVTRAPAPCPRRKPLLEPLENRLLLSADPLGAIVDSGVLALRLGEGNDAAVVERIGASAAGGDIVAVTLGAVTQRYGDEFFGIVRLLIDAGAGDDWLRIIGVQVTTEIIGGLGTDTFEWQSGDTTWSITAHDTGHVETVTFASFEHLVGADAAADTFVFAAGASVSGGVAGGAGGHDAVVVEGGEYRNVVHTASGRGAGTIALDDTVIAYDGIEPVTLDATIADLTLNGSAADDSVTLYYDGASGRTLLDGATGTSADVAFLTPTASLTINLGHGDDQITVGTLGGAFAAALAVAGGEGRDRVDFAGTVATHGHDLEAAAETIAVGRGSLLRTDLGARGAVGDVVLAATDAPAAGPDGADASVTVDGATIIARNITISATAAFTVNATLADADSTSTVAIFGASELAAASTLRIEVRSLVSAAEGGPAGPGGEAPVVALIVDSTAAARIGGGAALSAGDELAIDVANRVDLTGAAAPAAAEVALDTAALVEDGATLAATEVSVHAASEAAFAPRGAAAHVDFAATTRADIAGAAEVGAQVVLVSVAALERVDSVADGDAATEYERANRRGLADAEDDPRGEPLWPDAPDRAPTLDLFANPTVHAFDDGLVAALYANAAGRLAPDGRETAVEPAYARLGQWLEHALPAEADANGERASNAELPDAGLPLASALVASQSLAARSGPAVLPLPAEAEGDARSRRPAAEGDRDDEAGDTGLGASLVFSVLKDSTLAELARSVASGGGTVVLSAGSVPFARGRVRGGPESADPASGGALEIAAGDTAGAVVVSDLGDGPGGQRDLAADLRDALRSGAADLVLATAARHDLVAEAEGGAEPGTAVTPAAPIDVAAASDDDVAADGQDTFTLAAAPDAGDDVRPADVAGLALSTDLAPLEYELAVGSFDDAIRSGDGLEAFAGERVIAVSDVLDPTGRAPGALAGRASGAEVKAHGASVAAAPVGESREAVIACIGTFVAPIAASTGLVRAAHRDDGRPGATRSAARVAFAHRDAFRGGGEWAETFVNELGVALDDQDPNAKIKIKL